MSENDIGRPIREAFEVRHKETPAPFEELWSAAESKLRQERRRYATFVGIAAAVAIVAIGLLSYRQTQTSDEFLIAESLLNKTQWSAPSDVLLPQHQYDIYREVPFLVEPMNTDEGLFL